MLVLILGNLGSGKTLLLTILAYFSNKSKIITDYNLSIQNKQIIHFELEKFTSEEYNNSDLLLDEGYNYLESRISSSNLNRAMSYVLFQSRKQSMNIYITAQLMSSIDLRFRDLIDYIVICEKTNQFNYVFARCIDFQIKTFKLSFENASYFFKMYNTNQIITNDLLTNAISSPKTRKTLIESISEEIVANLEKPFTKSKIRLYLTTHKQNTRFLDEITTYIKIITKK